MEMGGQRHAPVALSPGMTRYPLYRRLGRPQGRSGWVVKISPPSGFDPRTVQLLARRYTDYAIPVPLYNFLSKFILLPVLVNKICSDRVFCCDLNNFHVAECSDKKSCCQPPSSRTTAPFKNKTELWTWVSGSREAQLLRRHNIVNETFLWMTIIN